MLYDLMKRHQIALGCETALCGKKGEPAEQYIEKGDLKAAEIQLRNAIREAPQDPILRAPLAQVYLQEGDAQSAERAARAARERNGNVADYLPVLADALLGQEKFANLMDLVQPGDRGPALESKLRTALATAAWGLADRAMAETLLDEAIKLDPSAARPKIQLARLLSGTEPAEADKLIDEAVRHDANIGSRANNYRRPVLPHTLHDS